MRQYIKCTLSKIRKVLKRRAPVFLMVVGIVVILFKWKLVCVNVQSKLHITSICSRYENGKFIGNLCQSLCHTTDNTAISCHAFHMEKEAVFTGIWMNNTVVYKSIKTTMSHRIDYNKDVTSLERDFIKLIQTIIKMKFNLSINDIDAKRMSYIQYSQPGGNRYTEIQNVWSLIQDNEYLALSLYEKYDVFPKLLGTCGSLYAVQKLDSISGYWHMVTLYDSQKDWEKRVQISIMILDFLLLLDKLPEPMVICDVKMNHFGVTSDFKKIKYLDLDAVHPISVANTLIGSRSHCKEHSDCDLNDCRSFCNFITHKCQHGVVNNNLQMVCERIFLGWVMSTRVQVPGLLFDTKAPTVLIEVLEKCANPSNEDGPPRSQATIEIRNRLYKLLTHLLL